MSSLREKIKMSQEETLLFLKKQISLQIGTINKDGSPHLTTMWYLYDGSRFIFHTYTKSQKIINLKRDSRITLLTEKGSQYSDLQGIIVYGTAEIISGKDSLEEVTRHMEAVGEKYIKGEDGTQYLEGMKLQAPKRSVVVVKPSKFISWDHTKI
ncbi:MAG: PPOX class F420-dependent oxidoreductase [Candidatus Actinomarinales bacterium]|nr:MAG: PPOX class F420-dependent oxidoreductase [Candidatus Actinomarinales bacterium]